MRTVTGWALVLRWGLVVSLVATVLVGGHASPADAVEEAKAASGPPLHIALFISSREDLCHDPGDAAAVRRLATVEQRRINSRGGVAGRPIEIKVLDDGRDEARAAANMRTALADRNMLGMVGMSNSTRAKAVFDALGKEIGASGIPFLSEISVSSVFASHVNVFTMRPSQDEERVPVMAAFTRALGFVRPAFLGNADSVMSDAMRDSFRSLLGASGMVGDHRIRAADGKTDAAEVDQVVAALAAEKPDMIFLAVGSRAAPAVISRLIAANLTPALFVTGRIDALPADLRSAYP
ncbi:ABC transporter substrate-binding protein, partial [Chelatococcus sp.]|uniref:ABC transporter substrate-binding protein n=1 Tax=Chelatococcus sp. TaxID=1953771 RepID=UPI0025C139DD